MTAEEFLKDNCYIDQLLGGENSELYEEVKVLMNLYAKHHVKEALKAASDRASCYEETCSDGYEFWEVIIVDKKSILNAYLEENII